MNNYRKSIHKITNIICLLMIIVGIIRSILVWNTLPDNIGVHFSGKGTFDVFLNKKEWIGLCYPYIVSIFILLLSELFIYILNKIKVGLKINEKKENIIKLISEIFIDISIKTIWIFFLSVIWSDCIIRQHYLNTTIPKILFYMQGLSIIILIISIIVIRIKKK